MLKSVKEKHDSESRVRGSASVLLKNWSFPCAIAPTYWAHPSRTVAGSRLLSSCQASGVCLAGMAGMCPLSRACSGVYKATEELSGLFCLFVGMPCIKCPFSRLQESAAAL